MVHSEKIVTMIDGDALAGSLEAVTAHRGARLRPLLPELAGYPLLAQRKWEAWVRKQRLTDRLPLDFDQLLASVASFADPALARQVAGRVWVPEQRRWQRPSA